MLLLFFWGGGGAIFCVLTMARGNVSFCFTSSLSFISALSWDLQRFHGWVLGDKGTLTNKLGRGVPPHHCRQPKGNIPLLDCLTRVPIRV